MGSKVREAARREGLEVSAYLRDAAEARLRQSEPNRWLTETELLERINIGFSEEFWNRFRTLAKKGSAGTLTTEEHQEMISYTDQTELRDAERLSYLIELSKRRGVTVQSLMAKLGLKPVSFD